jgi:recombination protein RecT
MANPTPPSPESQIATIKSEFERRKPQLVELLPKHLTAERLLVVALNCIQKTPDLLQCTLASLLNSIRVAAELGLEPGGVLGQLYLVPFKDKHSGTSICTPIIGYRGFIELMRRSGEVEQVEGHVVREGDIFECEFGLNPKLRHIPDLDGDGKPTLAYVIIRLKDGGVHVEAMTTAAIERVRGRSRSASSGPWVTDWDEMAKKTVLRRAAKWAPIAYERWKKAQEHDTEDFIEGQVVPTAALAADNGVVEQVVSNANERAKEKIRRLEVPSETTPAPVREPGSDG